MSKPVTFDFQGATYTLDKEALKTYDREDSHTYFRYFQDKINPYTMNPYDARGSYEEIQLWYEYEMTRLNWTEAAMHRAHKRKFGWRYWFRFPYVLIMGFWALYAGYVAYYFITYN